MADSHTVFVAVRTDPQGEEFLDLGTASYHKEGVRLALERAQTTLNRSWLTLNPFDHVAECELRAIRRAQP